MRRIERFVLRCLAIVALATTVSAEDAPNIDDDRALSERLRMVRERGSPEDRVAAGEALLARARRRIEAGVQRGVSVTMVLADALDVLRPIETDLIAGDGDPELRARGLYVLAWSYLLRSEAGAAAERLARVDREALPETWRALIADALARVLLTTGNPRGAAEAFLEAGNDRGAASSFAAARAAGDAARLYARLLVLAPDDDALRAEAMQAARFADAGSALADALEPAAFGEAAPVALIATRAEALGIGGRNEDAIEAWRAVLEREPRRPGARVGLAERLAVRGTAADLDEAVDLAAGELVHDPTEVAPRNVLWAIARADFERLHTDGPDGRRLARCLLAQETIVAADPTDPSAWSNLGNTLRVAGRATESLEASAQAVELDPGDPALISDRGLALAGAGDAEGALRAFLAALAVDPGHLPALQDAARVLIETGRPVDALDFLARALAAARRSGSPTSSYRILMGRAYRAARDTGTNR